MNLPANRFPSGPVYDSGAEPQYICSTNDCGADAWTPEEHHQCIVCKRRFCKDCLVVLGAEKYCKGCAKCACGQPALISCDECGKLVCADHLAVDPVRNECKPCRNAREDEEYRAWTAYYGSQYYGGWNRDPKDGRYKPQAVIDAVSERKPAAAVQPIERKEAL